MNTKHRILSLREAGYSDRKISEETGVPQPTVSRAANGADPRESTVMKISALYSKVFKTKSKPTKKAA